MAHRSLLDRLARVADDEDSIWLEGHLLTGPSGCVRLLIGGLYLDFEPGAITSIERTGGGQGYAVPARVSVRPGAAIHDVGSSEPFARLLGEDRVPFAVAVREPTRQTRQHLYRRLADFTIRERRFLAKYGLGPHKTQGRTHDPDRRGQ